MEIFGKLLDRKTNKPIEGAGIFLHNGEIKTDKDGRFVLTLNDNLGLGAIKEGYATETCDVEYRNNEIIIYILPEKKK
jgi:hypothetical protein